MAVDSVKKPYYKPLIYFLSRYRFFVSAIFCLTVVSAVVDTLSVVAFFPMFSSLLGGSQEEPAGILGLMTRIVAFLPFSNPIVGASVLLISVFLAKTVFTLLREFLSAQVGAIVHYDIKKEVLERYSKAHYQYMLDNHQGTLIYNSLDAPSSVPGVITSITRLTTALLKTVILILVLITILPAAALVLVALSMVYYAATHYISNKISYRIGVQKVEAATAQIVIANEFLSGFRQIITLSTAKWWIDLFDQWGRTMKTVEVKEATWQAVPRPLMELSAIILLLGLILTVWLFNSGGLAESLAKVGVFAVGLAQLMPPLTTIGSLRMKILADLPRLDVVHQIATGSVPQRREGDRVLESFEEGIAFEDVSFAYENRPSLLNGLDLRFDKGTVTAIVGSSGAGKTTIVNLILGLFQPTIGRITIDGIPLQELKADTWLKRIGFVGQEPFTYHSTVAANILLGRHSHSEADIVEASEIANAHEFISELPEGYDTLVGERGMRLSGGQQQRIAIARALLDAPDVLIFDEATSNLDSISEKLVQDAIETLSVNRTVIIIAHRLSTIRHADKIIVFDNGRVVEQGTHQGLLNDNGYYARLAGVR